MFYFRPQRSWGKVIFSLECVKNCGHRGGSAHCMLGSRGSRHPPGPAPHPEIRHTSPPGQTHTPGTRHPPDQTPPWQCMLGDTGNKWAVRILLESNLVHGDLCAFQFFIQSSPMSTSKHHLVIYVVVFFALQAWMFQTCPCYQYLFYESYPVSLHPYNFFYKRPSLMFV